MEESDGQDSTAVVVRRPIVSFIDMIVSFIDMITIGLRTTEESCPSDSSTAVITLNNFSHHYLCCVALGHLLSMSFASR